MGKQDKIVDWLVNPANFSTCKQILTNHIAWNNKLLTAHKSKYMFWKGEPSDYISRGDKCLSNSVVYYSVGQTKMLFFWGFIYKSLIMKRQILYCLPIMHVRSVKGSISPMSLISLSDNTLDVSKQPILKPYNPKKLGNKNATRNFNSMVRLFGWRQNCILLCI